LTIEGRVVAWRGTAWLAERNQASVNTHFVDGRTKF
jgi:hypothetical protein